MNQDSRKEGKKRSNQSWIAIGLYVLLGAVSGILSVRYIEHFTGGGYSAGRKLINLGLIILIFYAAVIIQLVIHEAGHLVFGLLTGYRFCSFRIYSLMWLKENGKLRMKRLSIAGTGGQCLMAPPDMENGKLPVLLYNFGGAIMNLLTGAIFLALSFLLPELSFVSVFFMLLALVGVVFAIMNGVPLHMGPVDNDGCNALSLMRSQEARHAFWIQMKANELMSGGMRLRDMPEEWFAVPDDEAMRNSMISTIGVFAANRLMDEHRFGEADALMEHLLAIESGIVGLYRNLLTCDRIFVELITRNRPEAVSAMMTGDQKKIMKAMGKYPSVLRTEYALALLADGDTKKAENIRELFEKISPAYPYAGEIQGERELMNIAEEAVQNHG